MTTYQSLTPEQQKQALDGLIQDYAAYKARNLSLNMARGKPAPEQLELSLPLLDALPAASDPELLRAGAGDDYRNYGGLTGIPEARALMAAIMDVPPELVIVMGNASLQIMYDTVARAMTHGVLGSKPWANLVACGEPPAFLAPVPGYDRHFAICEHFGIRMIAVPMLDTGPDMNMVESLVANDASIKGIWCVPRYSNPTGAVYTPETVERLATMPTAADDFRIYWDNAYAVHDLYQNDSQSVDETVPLSSLRAACEQAGCDDRWYMFASTSKVTFPGAGIAAFAASPANLEAVKAQLAFQTIGPDKLNQLRHVLFLRDLQGVKQHMRRHAQIVAPKFACVLRVLGEQLDGLGIGQWTQPEGGYFISFTGLPKTAKRVVSLAKEAGVILTGAGATWPYGKDPEDSNIRIAPTYPTVDELKIASELFALCVKIASLEVLLEG
jgi:aspartate/methionine/tyrosine aminotransferase